ncbi:hypothetical protein OIV83_006368 [Microbotryomycetes sp. JL201]|nr:hypothetical protein OIV83_006368 [Microbotryomycetes sp. JL201]
MFIVQSTPLAEIQKNKNPLPALVLVVVESILEVFFLCATGWYLAKRGIVDDKAKKTLNKLNVSLFTPALLFSKVAFSLTPEKLADLYIIPIGFVGITAFSAAVAYVLGRLCRLKDNQRNFAIACAMFQNSNSLPIALMQSLIGEKMPLSWGPHDTRDQQLGRALSYLVLFSTLGIIVRWSIGVRLLTSAENQDDEDDLSDDADPFEGNGAAEEQDREATYYVNGSRENGADDPLIKPASKTSSSARNTEPRRRREGNGIENGIEGDGARAWREPHQLSSEATVVAGSNGQAQPNVTQGKQKKSDRIFMSFPNTPIPSQYGGSDAGGDDDEEFDDDEHDDEWGARRGVGRSAVDGNDSEFWSRFRAKTARVARPLKKIGKKIGSFMTVPLWAALLSLIVACIPPLQWALNEAEPLKSAIKNAGNCSVPITLVTLGAYFYRPSDPSRPPLMKRLNPFSKKPTSSASSTASSFRSHRTSSKPGETMTIVVSVVARMIVVPLCLLPLFAWYARETFNVADDPVFVVTACLLIGSPTAITLAQITSSASGATFEKLISKTLFVSYAIMTAPCTILLVIAALYIDKIQSQHHH